MTDIRRTILWVIFTFSMLMLWDQWQIHQGRAPTFGLAAPPRTAAPAATPDPALPSAAPAPARSAEVPPASALPTAAAPASVPSASTGKPSAGERIVVSTDVLRLTFDTEGGSLVRAELTQHAAMEDRRATMVLLDDSPQRVYVAQTGVIGAPAGSAFPNHKTVMRVDGARELRDGQNELVLRFESPVQGGLKLVKTWTLRRGAYDMAVRHELVNMSDQPLSPQVYLQILRDGSKPPGESAFHYTFTGPAVYTDAKKFQKIDFSDIEKSRAEHERTADNGWVAMVQHYFASAWLLASGQTRELFTRKVGPNLYAAGMVVPLGNLAPGASRSLDSTFFAGPQVEKMLERLAPGFELVKDYGWFTILAKPLYWLLAKLHDWIGNWGWAIVALVFLLKAAFYWLNAKAYQSMAKMKAIGPRIMELRDRYKDKPQQMQQEMMRIYREEKVNPMGGCFPILIQIPVFIALYWVLLSSVEMRNAPWILWVTDLAAPDPYYVLPLVMTLTTLLQTALNPVPPDPLQAKLMWFMPLAFSVMFFLFPAGLVLYWLTNNVLSIAQQWVINTRMGVPPQFNLPKFG